MSKFAKITLVGNIGKDAEKFTTPKSSGIRFSVAVTTGFGDNKLTSWYEITKWSKDDNADKIIQYLTKGKCVLVHGEPTIHQWTSNAGAKGTTVRVNAHEIVFVGDRPPAQQSDQAAPAEDLPPADPGADVPF